MKIQIEESDLRSVLEALEESLGYVQEEAENAQRLYGQYPTRQARIQGLKDEARKHMDAITAIREALAEDQAHYKKVIDDVQALFEAKREEAAIWQAAYETEKGFREQHELASASVEPVAWMDIDEKGTFSGLRYWSEPDNRHEVALYTSPQPAPQQEPVAYAVYHRMGGSKSLHWPEQHSPDGDANQYQLVPLYTSPPASKPWVGLTDDEVSKLIDNEIGFNSCCGWEEQYTRAIEAKLKEKNHG